MAAVRKGKRGAGGARKGRPERKTTEIVFDRSEVGWVLGKLKGGRSKASGYLIKSSRLVGGRKAGSGETSSGQLPILLQGLLLPSPSRFHHHRRLQLSVTIGSPPAIFDPSFHSPVT